MPKITNKRFIHALLRQPVDRTPVWIMRQAGRYLPEYRELRAKANGFLNFCKTPKMACEATLQPLRRFDLDAAIVFSDILTIPDAMGQKLDYVSGQGPVISDPVRNMADVDRLCQPKIEHLGYVMEAIELITQQVSVPVIGFAGSPWTVACYMVEGQGSKTFLNIRSMIYREPQVLYALLEKLATITTEYLNAQIRAGARAVMLFDTWGGLLSTPAYLAFSLNYMQKIAQGLLREIDGQRVPVIFFTKQGGQWLEKIAASGCDAVGVDWTQNLNEVEARIGHQVAIQGNMDPAVLLSAPARVRQEVQRILSEYRSNTGHVFNLGHGIDKETPIENVSAMIAALHNSNKNN